MYATAFVTCRSTPWLTGLTVFVLPAFYSSKDECDSRLHPCCLAHGEQRREAPVSVGEVRWSCVKERGDAPPPVRL